MTKRKAHTEANTIDDCKKKPKTESRRKKSKTAKSAPLSPSTSPDAPHPKSTSTPILPPNWKKLRVKLEEDDRNSAENEDVKPLPKKDKTRPVAGVDFEYPTILPPRVVPASSPAAPATSKRREKSKVKEEAVVVIEKDEVTKVARSGRRRSGRIAQIELTELNARQTSTEGDKQASPALKLEFEIEKSGRKTEEVDSNDRSEENESIRREVEDDASQQEENQDRPIEKPNKARRRSARIKQPQPQSDRDIKDEPTQSLGPPTPSTPPPRKRKPRTKTLKSPYFQSPPTTKYLKGQAIVRSPSPNSTTYGLIQESISHNLYHLCIQAMLWNQTTGRAARPVLFQLMTLYPTPTELAAASFDDLAELLHPIGLFNIRAKRLIEFAQTWLETPPSKDTMSVRKGYPTTPSTSSYPRLVPPIDSPSETTTPPKRVAKYSEPFEICHLPGMGPYALDSYRMFHRDELRGLAKGWNGEGAVEGFEPEWKRVLPLDKELRPFLRWMWRREGWEWEWEKGRKRWVGIDGSEEKQGEEMTAQKHDTEFDAIEAATGIDGCKDASQL